ncbi:nucleoside hydrolase [Deinococcus yavapaiensis]|uniref:Purine nucleosidase n=1 Tax=Deinococcus yavapaiensis KR-236 TaxID=694435 RepID=A0A318S1U4_9DEIO|nr:nucleoside hydrolase [Deinococcus yavapaiensis]PYE48682.1 purine nucleosidase [Deinococcus yavapaiensis KR-236]
MSTPIILDCDPGHDDAVALLLALASSELSVLGVTVTHGNVELERTLANTLALREFAGSDVPVYGGAARPLVRAPLTATHVHGASGVGNVVLPRPTRGAERERAAEFIVRTALERPGEVTLVAIGPLTNVALALRLEPRLAAFLKGIVFMGGSLSHGNTTPAAEFNFHADPHAARIVLESGARITMFGLDATRQVPITRAHVERFERAASPSAKLCGALLDDALSRLEARGRSVGALHDPCTVAFLVDPGLFETRELFVSVDVSEGDNFGRSTADFTSATSQTPNVRAAVTARADEFYDLLFERLSNFPA